MNTEGAVTPAIRSSRASWAVIIALDLEDE
jgi:hypothetical protein